MKAEFEKARDVIKHAGMSGGLNLPRLMWQGLPYALSPSGRARPPLTLYWSVNSICNLHCKMCDVGTPNPDSNFFRNLRIDGKPKEIAIERFRAVVDEVAPYKPMISITSTEPLIYKPLGDAIEHAHKRGLDIAVTTGGYNLAKRAEELVTAGLTRINVSIDGPPALHNEIRGRKDSFERSTEGIAVVKELARKAGRNVECLVNFTVTNLNHQHLEAFVDSLQGVPYDRLNFSYMNFVTPEMATAHNARWGDKYEATVNCLNDDTRPDLIDVEALWQQIQAVKARGDARLHFLPDFTKADLRKFHHAPTEFMSGQRCMVNWFIGQVIASGDVIPYTRCYNVVLGNINEEPFLDIWNGERMRAWRRELRRERRFPACTRCDQCF